MKKPIRWIYATKKAKEYMERKHQVSWDEILEVLESQPAIYRTYPSPKGERRYIAFGRTESGRRLGSRDGDERTRNLSRHHCL